MAKSRSDMMVERLRNMQAAAPDIEASAVVSVDGLSACVICKPLPPISKHQLSFQWMG